MNTPPRRKTGLSIITQLPAASSSSGSQEGSSTHPYRTAAKQYPSAVDEVYADELLQRYTFKLDQDGNASAVEKKGELFMEEKDIRILFEDESDYPEGVDEEVDVYMVDPYGRGYLEKATVLGWRGDMAIKSFGVGSPVDVHSASSSATDVDSAKKKHFEFNAPSPSIASSPRQSGAGENRRRERYIRHLWR